MDIQQSLNELALFAGAGGGVLAAQLLGWRTVCAVERDAYAAAVLAQRQNDGILDLFPIWSDVSTFDGRPWRGIVDVISGGFPCQDISVAGKGEGISGARSGLWSEFARIISDIRPRFVFVENSPALTYRGLGVVLGDLAKMGFDAQWGVLGADSLGAPHRRDRIWIVANSNTNRLQGVNAGAGPEALKNKNWIRIKRMVSDVQRGKRNCVPTSWISRNSAGMANRVDRTKALGNGQVPAVAAAAWAQLSTTS